MFPLTDKKGVSINERDCVSDGEHKYSIYMNDNAYNAPTGIEAFSPTYGYLHALTPEQVASFERVGTFEEGFGYPDLSE